MRNKVLRTSVTVFLLALLISYTSAEAAVQSSLSAEKQSAQLYRKPAAGLMRPAYAAHPSEQHSLFTQLAANSGIFESFVVYPSGSWPEVVVSEEYTADGLNDAVLSTSFDWDPPNDNRVHLFAQTATSAISRAQRIAAGSFPTAIVHGDLEGHLCRQVAGASGDCQAAHLIKTSSGVATRGGAWPDGRKPAIGWSSRAGVQILGCILCLDSQTPHPEG